MRWACLYFAALASCVIGNHGSAGTSSGSSSGSSGGSTGSATGGAGPTGAPAVLSLTPTAGLDFGNAGIGSGNTLTVNVVNTGGSDATQIADASTNLAPFSYTGGAFPGTGGTCVATLSPSAGCRLALTFAPSTTGAASATLQVRYDDRVAMQTVSTPLRGTGNRPGAINKSVDVLTSADTQLANGTTATLTATKAPSDAAITLIALVTDPTAFVLIDQVTNPASASPPSTVITSGSYVANNFFTAQELNRVQDTNGLDSMVIPQTPDIDNAQVTPAGDYTFVVLVFDASGNKVDSGQVDVYVVHTPKGLLRHVDVNLYFANAAGLTASTAQSNAAFQSVVTTYAGLIGSGPGQCPATIPPGTLGLCVDSFHYFDLPAGYSDISGDDMEETAGDKDLTELFMTSAGKPIGINLFFVNSLSEPQAPPPPGITILGYDGAIPSPGAFMGTSRSGAVIPMDTLPSGVNEKPEALRIANTMAHETGHYLGLYHAQEADCMPDNISDTPCDAACTCAAGTCYSGAYDCPACPGTNCPNPDPATATAENMMYWLSKAPPSGGAFFFSPMQGQTVRLHPLVH